jgi:hypothetical protein
VRFIIDDGAFRDWDLPTLRLEESLTIFGDLLASLRGSRTPVGLLGGWGALQVTARDDLATILSDRDSVVDKDLRRLLLGLLGKCEIWDEDSSVVVLDDDIHIGEKPYQSLGIAYAVKAVSEGRGIGVLTMLHTGLLGMCRVESGNFNREISFVVRPSDFRYFYRSLYALENVASEDFFNFARSAFPDLLFADDLTFSKFDGGYALRDEVVKHLSALNDKFLKFYVSEHGNSAEISIRVGIDVSIEGQTRSSEHLMAMRDAVFEGHTYRCEWHSKLEPHRNRIHFCPGDDLTNSKIIIGIFVDHLPT